MASDLISRQAVLMSLADYQLQESPNWGANGMGNTDAYEAITECIRVIEQAPTIDSWKWTLRKEELPKTNGRYLVTRGLNACGALWNRVYILNYSDLMGTKCERIWWQGNVGKSDFERIDDVIAWMPLPNPYKEKDNE